ncbi:MAG: PAS domain S-box protein [Chloroflexi bacterium]|nr:PAS domain S-box protein [Chloroflexota bacterium]
MGDIATSATDSEHRYKHLFDITLDALEVVDAETGRIVLANQAAAQLFGFDTPSEMIGIDPLEYIPEADREWVAGMMAESMFEKDLHQLLELQAMTRDGRAVWISAMGVRTEYQGRLAGVISMMDITDRKQAEQALRESEQKYRLLTETMHDIVWTTDLNLRTTYVSPSVERVLGFTVEERLAQDVRTQMTPESYARVEDLLSRELEREQQAPGDAQRTLTVEVEYYHKDGSTVWLENLVSAIRNEQGSVVAIHGVSRNITDRKKAERGLRESEEKYRTLVENAGAVMFSVGADGSISYLSPAFRSIFGRNPSEVIGQPFAAFVHPEDFPEMARRAARVLTGLPDTESLEWRVVLPWSGELRWVRVYSQPAFKGTSVVGLQGIMVDITEHKQAEEAIRESERRYRLLAENSTDVIWTTDLNLRTTYVSPSINRLSGRTAEEAMRETLKDVFTPASASLIKDTLTEMLLASRDERDCSTSRVLELEIRSKDGSTIWTETTIALIPAQDGRPDCILGVTRDITHRVLAEEAMRESEKRYRLLAENATDMIWVTDLKLKPTYISPSVSRLLGYSVEEAMVGTMESSLAPSSIDRAAKAFAQAMAAARQGTAGPTASQRLELEFLSKDGSALWLDTTVGFIRDAEGRPVEIMGVLRDVTERREAEKALRLSEERLRQLIDTTSDWVWETDQRGIYTYVSPRIHGILGYYPDEVLGRVASAIMPPKSASRMAKLYGKAVDSVKPFTFVEVAFLHKDGHQVTVEISGVPFFDEDSKVVRGYRGIARDITQRKLAEEQVQQSYQNLQRMLEGTIQAITLMVETRDLYTAGHQQRVTQLACAIAQEMGLSNERIQMIHMAGRLHDLGKLFIPIEILSKPGHLSEIELAIIKTHPRASYDILKSIDFPWPVADAVLQHHERVNGSGYPSGLRGEEILLEARILAVSDVVEAMSSHRPYRPALGVEKALKEIVQNKGILYDPDVVSACLRVFWEKHLVLGEESAEASVH